MNKKVKHIIYACVVLIIVPIVFYTNKRLAAQTFVGCYIAHVDTNTYVFNIQSHDLMSVRGILLYRDQNGDGSVGTFSGTYLNGILSGDYTYRIGNAEFEDQVLFRYRRDTWYQGQGESQLEGNRRVFVNPGAVNYDAGMAFVKSDTCN